MCTERPPDQTWQELWPIVIAIIVPIIIVALLISAISLTCRHLHKRRMDTLLANERRLLEDDVLRGVQQVGENTLQVRIAAMHLQLIHLIVVIAGAVCRAQVVVQNRLL